MTSNGLSRTDVKSLNKTAIYDSRHTTDNNKISTAAVTKFAITDARNGRSIQPAKLPVWLTPKVFVRDLVVLYN